MDLGGGGWRTGLGLWGFTDSRNGALAGREYEIGVGLMVVWFMVLLARLTSRLSDDSRECVVHGAVPV
jgi:hypothetical protein